MKRMNYLLGITIMLMSFAFASCNKDENQDTDNSYNASNLTEAPEWLKAGIEEIIQSDEDSKYAYYMTATYKGETVFYYGNCNPLINYFSYVLNYSGEVLGNINDLYDELTDIKLFWKGEESLCNFNN